VENATTSPWRDWASTNVRLFRQDVWAGQGVVAIRRVAPVLASHMETSGMALLEALACEAD
jgi:uncharacterized membrane protein